MPHFVLALALALAPVCPDGQRPCSNFCIPATDTCHVGQVEDDIPTPPPPPPSAAEREALRLAADQQAEEEAVHDDLRERKRRLFIGLLVPGILATSTALLAVTLIRETDDGSGAGPSGPVCTTGKRCGNACIAVSDTCHVGAPDDGSSSSVTPTGWAVFGVGLALGLGFFVAAVAAPPRLRPRRISCGLSGCALRF